MQAVNYIPIDGIKVGDRIEVYTNYEDKVLRQYQQERHEENLRRYSELEKLRKESNVEKQ